MSSASRIFIGFLSIAMSGSAIGHIGAGEVDSKKLKSALAGLPRISMKCFGFSGNERARRLEPIRRAEVEKIRKSLTNDASDAERWQRMSELLYLLDEDERAKEAAGKAAELYRKLLEKSPGDARLLSALGIALDRAGKSAEAEPVIRKAIELGPKEWRAWKALFFHSDDPEKVPFEGIEFEKGDPVKAVSRAIEEIRRRKDAPDRIARMKKALDEKKTALDNAVRFAPPDEAEPYEIRGIWRKTVLSRLRAIIRALEGEQKEFATILFEEMACPEAVSDLEEASRRRPANIEATSLALCWTLQSITKGGGIENCDLSRAPEDRQRALREAMGRLEILSQNADQVTAVSALEMLAALRLLFKDLRGAEDSARAGIALDPSRDSFWAILFTNAAMKDEQQAFTIFKERVQKDPSAWSHFLLAKAYEMDEKWEEAEKELHAALKIDGTDFRANLGLAALLLRRAEGKEEIQKAFPYIEKAKETYEKSRRSEDWKQLHIVMAIGNALYGEIETARKLAKEVCDYDPEYDVAKEVLEALGGSGGPPAGESR